MWANYRCKDCNCIVEYKKEHGIDFPDNIKVKCKSNEHEDDVKDCKFERTFESVPVVSIAEGKTGIGGIYNPSPFTPMNVAYKGGRSSMFDPGGTASGSINYKPTG